MLPHIIIPSLHAYRLRAARIERDNCVWPKQFPRMQVTIVRVTHVTHGVDGRASKLNGCITA